MAPPNQFGVSPATVDSLRVASTFLHSLALSMTAFRVVHRWRRGKFFWDDSWAVVAGGFEALVLSCLWLRAYQNDRADTGNPTSNESRIVAYLVHSLSFTCVLWAARISISCSILRLLPPGRFQKIILCMTWAFGGYWLILFVTKSWKCGRDTSWISNCPLGRSFSILKVSGDSVADTLLVTIPLYMLWHSRLPKAPRRMIRVVFCASAVTTIISAIQATYTQGPNRVLEGFVSHFESAIIVMTCNLLVLVTFFYRIVQNGRDLDDELTTYLTEASQCTPVTQLSLTRISTHSELGSSLVRRGSSVFHISSISKGSVASRDTTTPKAPPSTSNPPS